jgi:hypothetical protein
MMKLENGISLPVKIKKFDKQTKQLDVTSDAFGNKVVSYSPYEISNVILPFPRKGIYLSALIAGGQTNVTDDKAIMKPMPKIGFDAGGELSYYFAEVVGISVGVHYAKYAFGQESDLIPSTVVPGNNFKWAGITVSPLYRIDATLKNTGSITSIDIPVTLKFVFGEVHKKGYYLNVGVKYSLINAAPNNSFQGSYTRYGIVDGIEMGKTDTDLFEGEPGLNFGKLEPTDTKTYTKGFYIYASGGLVFPLMDGKHYFTIGAMFQNALTTIAKGEYKDLFDTLRNSDVKPILYGLELGLHYRLW